MLRKLKNNSVLFGMIFTVASLLACFIFTWVIYEDEIFARMKEYLFDCGVDVMGAFTCAALYYGSMRQEGEGAKTFRALIVLTSAGFVVNALMYFTTGVPWQSGIKFLFVLLICFRFSSCGSRRPLLFLRFTEKQHRRIRQCCLFSFDPIDYTSSRKTSSAASPLLGPSLRMRV